MTMIDMKKLEEDSIWMLESLHHTAWKAYGWFETYEDCLLGKEKIIKDTMKKTGHDYHVVERNFKPTQILKYNNIERSKL